MGTSVSDMYIPAIPRSHMRSYEIEPKPKFESKLKSKPKPNPKNNNSYRLLTGCYPNNK